jgi:23S rRNA (guanosine2251-2'-O)-methyltransferase
MEHRTPTEDRVIAGRNPVIELLKSEQPIDRILMQAGPRQGSLGKIAAMAKEQGVPVKDAAKEKLDALCPGTAHQGVVAVAAACRYATLEEIEQIAKDKGEPLFLVLCDGIEDPHNLGAIIRTADAAGAHGVVIPRRHGVGLTATAVKASAGATAHLPVARVANLASVIDELKKKNVWVYAADMGGTDWCAVDYAGAAAVVVGSEGEGVSRLIREKSDVIVGLPMFGQVNSLNASVAAALVLYEVARQRHQIKAK